MKYSLSEQGFVLIVFVELNSLLQPVMVFVDHYWLRQRFGVKWTLPDLDDDIELQTHIAFFLLNEFSVLKDSQRRA